MPWAAAGGQIAYEVAGDGRPVILLRGTGDAAAACAASPGCSPTRGTRVASVDVREHGRSSTGWNSVSRAGTAGDLIAVVRHRGGPATNPELVTAIVETGPVTWPPRRCPIAQLSNAHPRCGTRLRARLLLAGNLTTWSKSLDGAYPGRKPADWLAGRGRYVVIEGAGHYSHGGTRSRSPTRSCLS